MHNLSNSYNAVGRFEDALTMREKTLELRKKVLGSEHEDTIISMGSLAYSYGKNGHWKTAETQYREFLAARKKQSAKDWQFFFERSSLGAVLTNLKKYAEAERMLLAGYHGLESIAPGPKWLKHSIQRIVTLYTDWGKPEKAAEWQAKLDALEGEKK